MFHIILLIIFFPKIARLIYSNWEYEYSETRTSILFDVQCNCQVESGVYLNNYRIIK